MEGPRAIHATEFASLNRLVNAVFGDPDIGDMFTSFPSLFDPRNRENLLVMVDEGEVVSHAGMVQRWASLNGCTVRVGCIGAVATYESHRGQGLASRLFEHACEKARRDGVDFLMISGDRPLYLAAGATYVGRDRSALVGPEAADALGDPDVSVEPLDVHELDACRAAYDAKPARFVRPLDDWRWSLDTRRCAGRAVDWSLVRKGDATCGYLIHRGGPAAGLRQIVEWAGDATAVAGAIRPLIEERGEQRGNIHIQRGDSALRGLLLAAGVELRPVPTSGTYLLINFEQLMGRLRPFFETQIGIEAASRLSFARNGDRFLFGMGEEREEVEGKAEAARVVFGHPELLSEGLAKRLFPAPSLWYGANYV